MTSSKTKSTLKKLNPFSVPDNAAAAGAHEFRTVSGWRPLFKMEESDEKSAWKNEDLVPTPLPMRVWSWSSFFFLWICNGYGAGGWSGGASLVVLGLTVPQAIGISVVATLMTSTVGVLAGRIGAVYHVGYPVWCRSTFGMYGSKVMVAFRGAVAIIWYAVQTYYCAEMMNVLLHAIFGSRWSNLPNHLPASSNTTTARMVCYFITWLAQVPVAFVHPSTSRHFFTVKSILLPISVFAFLGGLIHLAGGSVSLKAVNPTATVTGSAMSWSYLHAINVCFGNISPMLINQPDIARYSNKPSAALLPQWCFMTVGAIVQLILGIIAAAAITQAYGITSWNAWDMCELILEHNWNGHWRAGIALFCLVQCFGTIVLNSFANCIPFGCDMAGVFPKYINILRGQVFCMVVSWAICPWSILTSGVKFVIFLGSYTVFMAGLMAILLTDYYVIRRGNLHIPSLYDAVGDAPNRDGLYFSRHYKGYEIKAFIAWLCSVSLTLPGLAYSYTNITSPGATAAINMYNSGYLISFSVGGVAYYLLCRFWDMPDIVPARMRDEFVPKFESLGKNDGYFLDEPVITYGRQPGSEVESSHTVSESPYDKTDPMNEKGVEGISVSIMPVL